MTQFTTHDSQVKKLYDELKAKEPALTDRERKQLELFTQGMKEKDLITTHKMEYEKAGLDHKTGKKLTKKGAVGSPTITETSHKHKGAK